MKIDTSALEVVHNAGKARYELHAGEQVVGVCDYRLEDGSLVLTHTEIEPSLRGLGLGERLVAATLDDVRTRGTRVVPVCWFVADFIRDNEGYADLLAPGTGA